jgi:hypothetical protein
MRFEISQKDFAKTATFAIGVGSDGGGGMNAAIQLALTAKKIWSPGAFPPLASLHSGSVSIAILSG